MTLERDAATNVAKVLSEALPYIRRFVRQNPGDQIRRQRHGERRTQAGLRPRHRADESCRHQPGGGARRRPANRRPAQAPDRSKATSSTACASPTPQTMDVVEMVLGGQVNKGHRQPDQPARRQRHRPDRQGRRADPREEAQGQPPDAGNDPAGNHRHRPCRRSGRRSTPTC